MFQKNKLFDQSSVNHGEVIERLVAESSPRKTYILLITLSSIIATLGLLNEAPEVIIGAMLVAPILWPILGIGMGLIVRDWRMIRHSLGSIFIAIIITLAAAIAMTLLSPPLGAEKEILRITNYSFMLPVAICSGIAASFALCFKELRETITGVAISVALLPPLAAVGIGLGSVNWDLMQHALNLFLLNIAAIGLTSFAVFALLGFRNHTREVVRALNKEEKILESTS